jgi:hypothetical protein
MQSDIPTYRIRLHGHLSERGAQRFEGMTVTRLPEGDTLITGSLLDQSALHGVLERVRDMGITLIEVVRIDPGVRDG